MDWNLFFEVHCDLPREGPGSDECTRQALSLITELPADPAVLDVGCGPGRQTLIVAQETGGRVTAIDTHEPFLARLRASAAECGLAHRITALNCPMHTPPAEPGTLDLVWSEGAIYIMGFDEALRVYRELLKPGGWMAVSEATWLKPNRPAEIQALWDEWYPGMRDTAGNLRAAEEIGFDVVHTFTLPESAWWDAYYTPMEARLADLRVQYADNAEALAHLDIHTHEIQTYRRYSEWYGYVFYILRRPG